MENPPIDWSTFTRKIIIEKPLGKVYNAWSNAEMIETWFLKSCEFKDQNGKTKDKKEAIETGDTYSWVWHGWPEHVQDGIITSVLKNEIRFTFGKAGNVILKFRPVNSGTEIELTQLDIPTDEFAQYHYYYGCTMGWSFWMVNLKAYLEHGILLDERSGNYKGDMSYINQ